MNRAQYQLSKRQDKRARRRAAAGLPPVEVVPMGPRKVRGDGKPIQRYRRDELSASYRRKLTAQAADAAAGAQARRARARTTAADIVTTHGYQLIIEDTRVATWSRTWGAALAAFSPGLLVAAIDREARAVATLAGGAGGVTRASTRTTALSQHCPCGARAAKRLGDRVHHCSACRLRGDRDAVAAVLASFVMLDAPGDPGSARVDYDAARAALPAIRRALTNPSLGWQDTLPESTDLSACEGRFLAWPTSTPDSVVVARRTVGMAPYPTLDETDLRRTTSERVRTRTNMSNKYILHGRICGTRLSPPRYRPPSPCRPAAPCPSRPSAAAASATPQVPWAAAASEILSALPWESWASRSAPSALREASRSARRTEPDHRR